MSFGIETYLSERERVKLVLAGQLKTSGLGARDVVASLGADLDGAVDLLVVRGHDDVQVLHSVDGGVVGRGLVSETETVAGDSALADVVGSLTTDEEALVAGDGVNGGVDVAGSGAVVDESAGVHVRVLPGEVQLLGS